MLLPSAVVLWLQPRRVRTGSGLGCCAPLAALLPSASVQYDVRSGRGIRVPAIRGEMTIMIKLANADGGTHLVAVHDGLPSGVVAGRTQLRKLSV
jgi:hypothetical protein